MSQSNNLVEGPVYAALLRISAPMTIGLLAVLSQSLVDSYFVAKLGTDQLAALSFTFPVALAFTSLSIGLSAGAGSVVSRFVGSKESEAAKRACTDGVILSGIIVTLFSILTWLGQSNLFSLLGASDEIKDYIERYMNIWFLSMPFLVMSIAAHGSMRAIGDGLAPSILMVGAALINVVLTPILMNGWSIFPALNIEGIALATLIARVILLFATLIVLYRRSNMLLLCIPNAQAFITSAKNILKIALPAGASNVMSPVSIAIVTALLADYGSETVAAFGVATRVEALACIVLLALSASLAPVAGQNWGAGKHGRVLTALRIAVYISVVVCALLVLVFQLAAEHILYLFDVDNTVAEIGATYLKIISYSLFGYGIVICFAATFNGIGFAVKGLFFNVFRLFALYVPLAWLAFYIYDEPSTVFYGLASANVLSGVGVGLYGYWWLSRYTRDKND